MSTYLDNNNAIIPLGDRSRAWRFFYNATDWLSFVVDGFGRRVTPTHLQLLPRPFDGDLDYFTYFRNRPESPHLSGRHGPTHRQLPLWILPRPAQSQTGSADRSIRQTKRRATTSVLIRWSTVNQKAAIRDLGLFFRYGQRPGDRESRRSLLVGRRAVPKGCWRAKQIGHTVGFGMYSAIGSDLYRRFR